MLNLAATESLQGNAGTGSVVTYTVTGMEITAGVEAYKILGQGSLAAVTGALYTTPGSKQGFVKKIHLLNTSALPILVAMFVNGTAATNQFGRLLIPANGSATYAGEGWHVLDSSGFLQYVGATGPTGAKGAQYIGIYSAAVNYVADNIVSDNGTAWICLVANGPSAGVHAPPTIPTTSNTWWSLVASKGDQGIQGIQGNPGVVTTITAGSGLTGGGSAATVNLDVNPDNSTIEVVTDQVKLKADGTTNTFLAPMVQSTLKGRAAGAGTGGPSDLTATQATAILDLATLLTGTALKGLMSSAEKTKLAGKWVDAVADLGLDKTGANATANTTALRAAMTGSTFTGGGVLFFPAGTYALNGTITIDKAVIVCGAGRAITNIRMDDVQLTQFALAYGSQGAGFEQVRLTGGTTGLERTGRPVKTTVAAGSNGVTVAGGVTVLNLTSATGLAAATPTNPQVLSFESRFPAPGGGTDVPYWGTLTYTGITANQLTGVSWNPATLGRTLTTNDRVQQGGFAVDFGDIANVYMQQCDILFHKNGVRSMGALQFLDDLNIREMNNSGRQAGAWGAAGSAIDTTDAEASACVLVDGAGDRYLRRLTTDNAGDWAFFAAVRINQCSSCVMSDNNLINGNWALDIFANGGLRTAVASVMAVNTFFDSSTRGARIRASATDTVHRVRFVQCWFSTQTEHGVSIEHANCNSIDFIGCDFFQNVVGIEVTAASDWAVRASRFSGNTTAGIRTTAGATHRFSISDNFIGNGGGFGANQLGINIQAGAYNGYSIADNRGLESNTVPGITDNGTVAAPAEKTVRDNLGTGLNEYSVSNSASQTIGASALTNLTGLAFPVVQPNLAYAFEACVNANISATGSFAIGVGVAIPAGASINYAVMGPVGANTVFRNLYINAGSPTGARSFITAAALTGLIKINGVVNAGTATSHTGQVQIQLCAATGSLSTNAGTATIQAGTSLIAQRIR